MAMKVYRVLAFEGRRLEVLEDQCHLLAADLDTPHGMALAGVELADLRRRLMDVAKIPERERSTFRLRVCDVDTGQHVMDWVR